MYLMENHPPAVLLVCTANICRSPIAEGLLKALVARQVEGGYFWRIESAGTWTRPGLLAAPFSVQVMAERGIDISNHTSQSIEDVDLSEFDLILTMESGHKEAIRVEFPETRERVLMLKELVNQKTPIADPVGQPIEVFRQTANEIEQTLHQGLPVILQMVSQQRKP
ncbi:hypothetical protein ADN00_16070 [Ornatilinea apprima]|uniref:Phosphotyrosine protein phosphatase I domain-containing protein n=2 Tax=Ornatilinea apprima TaxID=1134406 RepID=A0A0P6XBD1_9CHLR|nr:hypothetical protein ADN00_16070 [Ornatilinea apprima]